MRFGQDDWATDDDGATLFCEYIAGWVGAQKEGLSLCRHKEAMIVGDRRSPEQLGGGECRTW